MLAANGRDNKVYFLRISADIVLLMDDVTTTGNSLYVCKEILLNRGAANVEMFALGKAI